LRPAEVNQVLDRLDKGSKLTYVDGRQTLTGIKANNFFLVRPDSRQNKTTISKSRLFCLTWAQHFPYLFLLTLLDPASIVAYSLMRLRAI